jgi:uncharacterized RDD family membrane protein YckC
MVCPNCSKQNLSEARFCYNCGSPFPVAQSAYTPVPLTQQFTAPPPYGYTPPPPYGYNTPPIPQGYYPPPQSTIYNPEGVEFVSLHPLAIKSQGLPFAVLQNPSQYYSYISKAGKLRLAQKANYGRRFAAGLLDWVIASLPGWIVILSNRRTGLSASLFNNNIWWITLISVGCYFGYYFFSVWLTGKTLGKKLLGLKIIRLDGQSPDAFTSFLRHCLGYTVSSATLLLGFLWPAWDARRMGFHDKLARTLVIYDKELEEGMDFILLPL